MSNTDLEWLSVFHDDSIPLWINDPVLYMREVLLFEPDEWQLKVAYDLRDNPRVAVKSGQGVGKTGVEAALLLWFLTCFPNARVVSTAPTSRQLHDVLWAEVAKWMNNSPLLNLILKWTKTYIYVIGNEKRWFATARTATKPENMQGFHEENMLFIVDEASGVADNIMEAIQGTLSGSNNKLLLMGNPTRITGYFHDAFTSERAMFKCHTVNSELSPRTNKENIEALARKYGRESNVFRVRVSGEFPLADDDVLIPIQFIEQSIMTEWKKPDIIDVIRIGCDVARFGDDKTVITYRLNEKIDIYLKINGQDTMKTADKIIELGEKLIRENKNIRYIPVTVDDGGIGGAVVDRLNQMKRINPARFNWLKVFPIHFGMSIKHAYYADTTSFMMGTLKSMLQPYDEEGHSKPVEIILPNDVDMIGQLSVRKYTMDTGKIKVESKKAMKERGLPSPDEADSILLCCVPVRIREE